jgi:hypothetical protein
VAACQICRQNKYQALKPAGLLHPLPIPAQGWEGISTNFISGLPKTKGANTIMGVVDRLSKYAYFIPLLRPFTAKEVAVVFAKEIVCLQGFPTSIVSDRDHLFLTLF